MLETCDENAASATSLRTQALLHFHRGVSARNKAHGGIHPLIAAESHQENLAVLVQDAVQHLPVDNEGSRRTPDFISVTRGPGMRSCLNTGLDTAKGLSVAWQIPLVGVHHMQAHALTPRLVSALESPTTPNSSESSETVHPAFPFLTLLASGGHTLLLHSKALCDHTILASTSDVAIGGALDKMARDILPPEILESHREDETVVYGRLLEEFAFPEINRISSTTTTTSAVIPSDPYNYTPPQTRAEISLPRPTPYGWALPIPFGEKRRHMEFSFSGLGTSVARICGADKHPDHHHYPRNHLMSMDERRHLASEAQRVCFEHLASRVCWALEDLSPLSPPTPPTESSASTFTSTSAVAAGELKTVILSGGVASNSYLRHILPRYIASAGPPPRPPPRPPPPPPSSSSRSRPDRGSDRDRDHHGNPSTTSGSGSGSGREIDLVCPPPALCTDNAAMIAWAGVEMWRAGWTSELGVRSRKTWSLDPEEGEGDGGGGVLGVGGWVRRTMVEES